MKVAVIGGTGLLGQAIGAEWRGDEVVLAGSHDVDICERREVEDFLARHWPDWVVLAAAYPDVDGCERNPELAEQVNHVGAIHVAEACQSQHARLMFISTDYVFDGSKDSPYDADDAMNPLSVYALSKAAAEKDVRRILPESCIARISWLFGAEKECFANTALGWAESGRPVRALVDQRGIPNYNHDLARALAALTHAGAQGTVHVTNPGEASWYEFTRELLRVAGFDVPVEPITMEELKRPARRPQYSALSDASLRRHGIRVRHWREALPDYLARRREARSIRLPANAISEG
jgi:dTDP-4-dehydrorhamnose reductase